jgi:hypothetical protein
MNYITICLLALFGSIPSFAMPNPTHLTLAESAVIAQYIADHMNEVIDTSAALAEKAVPNAHYYLVTDKLVIIPPTPMLPEVVDGQKPAATIYMSGNMLNCERDVFTKVKYDIWGSKEEQVIYLSKDIRCSLKK